MTLVLAISLNGYSQVESDHDPNVDFSQYKTFSFQPGVTINQGQVDKNNTLVDQKVNNAVTGQLNAKGLQQTSTQPDLMVTYTFGIQQKTEIENVGAPYGYGYYAPGGWWGNSWNNWWVNTYDQGTLIIDFKDTKTNKLVYRIYGSGEVKKPSKQQKEFDKIAEKGLKDFPS